MKVDKLIISDTHLGYQQAKTDKVLEVIKNTKCNTIVIVGDFIDIKRLKKKYYWDQNCNKIIQKILKFARDRQVIYVWGNHDKLDIFGEHAGNIMICREYPLVLNSGRTALVVHGDLFEAREKRRQAIEKIGGKIYDVMSEVDYILNTNFVKWGKKKLKNAKDFVDIFEEDAQNYAESKGYDAVICGHIHYPKVEIKKSQNFSEFLYCNTGDFVHNSSYLVETPDGTIKKMEI